LWCFFSGDVLIKNLTKKSIVIDTDIGDDVDDILALAYALTHKELEILGITTVFRNTSLRAKIASYFLGLADRPDIPVHPGVGQPIAGSVDDGEIPCQFGDEMSNIEVSSVDAIQFLASLLERQQITIVCIGPLTNIATLIKQRPDLIPRIDELVIMGGAYYRHVAEWNILCDPEAASIVFNSGVNIRAVGLDVTLHCRISSDRLKKVRAGRPVQDFLLEMCRRWFDHSGYRPILHDPLAIFALLDESDIQYQEEKVNIECIGTFTRGVSFCEEHRMWEREVPDPNVLVAVKLDYQRFTDRFMSAVFGD